MLTPHPAVESVWELRSEAGSGPRVGVLGAIHGNEVGGLRALERLMTDDGAREAALTRGTLVLIHGNPRATAERRRYTTSGTDLNRLFDFGWVERLAREAWTYEHHRAHALRPVLGELDALIDLHSASQPTVPFAIAASTPEGIALGRATGCRVTHGWDGPGMLMDHVSIGHLVARGRPALSVECGQHRAPETSENAWRILLRFLGALGVSRHPPESNAAPTYRLFGRVVKPTRHFELTKPFASFDVLAPGDVLGRGEGVTIAVEEEAHLLLPTPTAARGEDLVYLARKEP